MDLHLLITRRGIVSASGPGQEGSTGAPVASWYQHSKQQEHIVLQAVLSG